MVLILKKKFEFFHQKTEWCNFLSTCHLSMETWNSPLWDTPGEFLISPLKWRLLVQLKHISPNLSIINIFCFTIETFTSHSLCVSFYVSIPFFSNSNVPSMFDSFNYFAFVSQYLSPDVWLLLDCEDPKPCSSSFTVYASGFKSEMTFVPWNVNQYHFKKLNTFFCTQIPLH